MQVVERPPDDLEHRSDERNKVGLAAIDRLEGERTYRLQTTLDRLQTKFSGELRFVNSFETKSLTLSEEEAALFGEPLCGRRFSHAI